jgi:hypothetical protein
MAVMIFAIINLGLLASFLCCSVSAGNGEGFTGCIPSGIDLESVVAISQKPTINMEARRPTIKQRLIQLKAHCKRGKLVDGKGKQIYFYSVIGCWGNPPADYLDLLKQQNQRVHRLEKRYTVIRISCAQSVDPRTISQNSP